MEITKKQLEQLPTLHLQEQTHNNGGTLYLKNKTIYKIFTNFYAYQEEIERNTDYQITNNIPNTPSIYDKIYIDGKFTGYSMEYIENSLTFRDAINTNIPEEYKINAIKNIYQALKHLHRNNIYLGDIHSDNFLIDSKGNGYIIDLECMRFPGDEYKFQQCYLIKPNNNQYKINVASNYTDNIKVMLSSLSLLLDIDLEKYISSQSYDINLEEIYNNIIKPLNNKELNDYFKKIMNTEEIEYFDKCLERMFKVKTK